MLNPPFYGRFKEEKPGKMMTNDDVLGGSWGGVLQMGQIYGLAMEMTRSMLKKGWLIELNAPCSFHFRHDCLPGIRSPVITS